MTVIEPVKQNPLKPSETRKYSPSIRLWHWLNALVISGSLITVLINSTILDGKSVTALISGQMSTAKTALPPAAPKQIAHELSDSVWNVHAYIGLLLTALLIYRIIYEFIQPASQSLFKKISVARLGLTKGGEERQLAKHELVVKSLYAVFYLLLTIMAITGVMLFFEHQLGLPKNFAHSIKEVHGACMYGVIAFIIIHIAGVILAERDRSPGIVSDMINGGDKKVANAG